mmetsp:Transcript_44015/g.49326  ORF Transcript_44015/g.49326 Transcript_44015/m.49326 type:complete len:134 (+) Transcript_44015:140-541(+)
MNFVNNNINNNIIIIMIQQRLSGDAVIINGESKNKKNSKLYYAMFFNFSRSLCLPFLLTCCSVYKHVCGLANFFSYTPCCNIVQIDNENKVSMLSLGNPDGNYHTFQAFPFLLLLLCMVSYNDKKCLFHEIKH